MSSDFSKNRRERFLNEDPYNAFVKGSLNTIAFRQELIEKELPTLPLNDPAYIDWSWGIASPKVQLLIGKYSAGAPIEQIAEELPSVLAAVEASALPHEKYRTEPFYLDEPDTYAYAMWLLSLAKLLRLDYLVPRVAALFDVARDDNRGKDALFESLLTKLGESSEPAKTTLKGMKAHAILFEAIEAEPQKRPKLMVEFLSKWYPSMKACYWYGLHTKAPQNFFGYWAFEAGLVTYLWDIDDSGYREMPFYPKDLVAYARTHDAAVPSTALSPSSLKRQSAPAGLPCPESGFWFTPAKSNSRRYFTQGEVLPDFKTDFGSTIWQWDNNQSPPKL
jgi:hypothetical protein